MKTCSKCRVAKPLDDFQKHHKGKLGRAPDCRKCRKAYMDQYREKNPGWKQYHIEYRKENRERLNKQMREHNRRTRQQRQDRCRLVKYGITPEQFEEMRRLCGDVCTICKLPESTTKGGQPAVLSVDHDHDTGTVRGLLCNRCNRALGKFRDDPTLLRAAADYLDEHNASMGLETKKQPLGATARKRG